MAESAVGFLLNHLSEWLQEERKLFGGLRDELQIIRDVLQQMRVFLRVADAREESDPQLKEWVRIVREIAYDIEDVLESYMLESCAGHPSHGISGCMERLIYSPLKKLKAKHDVAYEIKALRYRAKNALKAFRDLHGVFLRPSFGGVDSNMWYDGRGDALLLEKADVVGIERPKRQLLKWISTSYKPDYALKVISVVGMVGLGKTTLVKKVYDDSWVKQNIDHHVWINVSKTYKVENLLQDMIIQLLEEVKQALPPRLERMTTDEMREFVYNFVQHKNYIIVLDDVWSANVWEALRYAFPRNSTDGRGCIIVTTRFRTIADSACCESGGHVYDLRPLSPQKAKVLFHKTAFQGAESCPLHLKEISDNILKRCGGLPLAIVVIGGVLATKRNEIEEWRKFNHNLGYELEEDNRMWKVLSLSYYDLPYYLKACLLYLSIFPEDHLLEKATIIRLWIAEGFVETKQGKTMEEIAAGYLNELCNRSMIQIAKITKDGGRPKKYRIHDLVREYIFWKAREQNLVAVMGERRMTWDDRIRHLALADNFSSNTKKMKNNFKCLRTLLFFGSVDLEWRSILCNVLHGGCRMLKELDLRGAPLDAIPDEVFKLYLLKYLSLRDTNVSHIPKAIGNLEKLETLDLKGSQVTELPIEILKLQRLRYLSVYKYDSPSPYLQFDSVQSFKAPYEIGQLLHLQKLCYIDASVNLEGNEIVKQIGRLTELRRLSIVKLRKEDGKDLCSSLTNPIYLSSLIISSLEEDEVIDLDYEMPSISLKCLRLLILRGRLERVPQWIPSLSALTTLRFRWSKMVDDPLEDIQDLPNLQILEMDCGYEGEGLTFKWGGFQMLKQLDIGRMKGLRWMRVEKGSMPSLKSLVILDCKVLMEVSSMGIEHLRNLDHVGFIDMTKGFVKRVVEEKKREGKGWKLAHVPAVVVAHWANGQLKYRRL